MFPKKKPFLFVLTIILVMGLFIGCSKTKDSSSAANTDAAGTSASDSNVTANTAETNNSSSDTSESSEFGQVTAINGSTITLSVFPGGGGNMPGNRNGGGNQQDIQSGEKPDMQSGDAPDMQSGERPDMQSGERPDMQSGEAPDMQSGERPDMQSGDTPNMQSVETEEKEITISDESIIKIQDGDTTKDGTLADITVGSMLQVSYTKDASGNDVLSSVLVRNMGQDANGNNNGNAPGSTESEG